MTPPPQPLSSGEQANKSTFKPILITLLCSFLLAGGSCFAALRAVKYSESGGSWAVFMVIFLAATLSFIVACIWLIVRTVRMAVQKRR